MLKFSSGRNRNTARSAIGLGLMLAAVSGSAAAIEEVVVHGSTAVMGASLHQAHFEADMAAYVKDVEAALRSSVRDDLERSAAPQFRLARLAASHRG